MGRSRTRNRTRSHTTTKALPPAIARGNQTNRPQGRSFAELLNQIAPGTPFGVTSPMPRDSLDLVPFGPINPLVPQPIGPNRRDTGRPEPWIREYPPGWNIPGNDNRLIPWDVLYNAADQVDIMRRCIEVRKRHVRSLKWNWCVSSEAVSAAYRADPKFGQDDLENQLRDKFWPQISKLTEFWTKPWRTKGLNLGQWVNAVQDQHLVLDAVAIYPRMTYGGDLFALELLDGSTIKPLIDYRGDRPAPPFPAFQQELYGFPRGEFTATTEIDAEGNEVLHGGYMADQLYYWQEVFRPRSFYGFSAVEQALMAARLYVKRQGWMLAEYDDGSTPLTWLVPGDGASELDPRQRREWENALNDDLSGQTSARNRLKLSYPGFKPEQMASVDERYKPDYDLYLIKLLAAHFGVPISELGFTESKGLGSSGYHEGQEDVMDRVGRRPDIAILEEMINDISHRWLDAPAELQFQFLGLESEDEAAQDAVADARVKGARMTLNEDRKRQGLPLYDFPEADMPMLMLSRGVVFLEGSSQLAPPGELVSPVQAPPQTAPPEGVDADPDDGDEDEQQQGAQPPAKPTAGKQPPKNAAPTPKPAPGKATAAAEKAADPTKAVAESDSTRDRVRQQLAEDYPDDAMDWLKSAVWSGPESVPTSDLDYSNEDQWAASHEDAKVERFKTKISAGKLKPIIVVNTPDARKYIIIDGHHRALAYRALGIPAMAYIGRVAEKTGPWDQMHASQRTGDSAPGKDTSASKAIPDAVAAEVAAYRNWARKHPNPNRQFRFEHPEAAAIVKAGGADPKAPASAKTWPGWDRDLATAAHYARLLTDGLTAIDSRRIAKQWATDRDMSKGRLTAAAMDAYDWLRSRLGDVVNAILDRILPNAYAEGYVIGARSATSVALGTTVDWGSWTPGDIDAAKLILGQDGLGAGLEQLLAQSGITITSMGDNRMQTLAQALADALANGDSADTLAGALESILADPSWADMVATTEIARAVSAASLQTYAQNGIQAISWLSAEDGRVCGICEDNEGAGPIPLDSSFPSGDSAPPGHPRCFPAGVMVAGPSAVAATARRYEGDLVTIVFADGEEVPVTPNHPVLTPDGWVAAGDLHKGRQVLRALDSERIAALLYPDDRQAVARIEDVAAALGETLPVATVLMPVASEDFHGDGAGDDQVKVVLSARHPEFDSEAALPHVLGELDFVRAERVPGLGSGNADAQLGVLRAPSDGLVRRCEHGLLLAGRGVLPADSHRGGTVAAVDAELFQHPADRTAADAMASGKRLDGLAGQVVLGEVVGRGDQAPVLEDAEVVQLAVQRVVADSGDGRTLADRLSGLVELDRVVELRRVQWSGHVFNLETVEGWYFANGIIAHNCRCTLIPEFLTGSDAVAALAEEE